MLQTPQAKSPTQILITGGSGFIGERLSKALFSEGHQLKLLTRNRGQVGLGEAVQCDLENDSIPIHCLEGIDTVYHLAGYAHDLSDPETVKYRYENLNIHATTRLAQAASKAGVRKFVYVSSVKAGGITDRGLDMNEDTQSQPDGIYGETKFKAEKALLALHQDTNLDVTVLRPSLVYGPSVKGNLNLMLRGIRQGWFPPVPETGNQRSMVHVDDVVDALRFLSSHPGSGGEIFIVTDGHPYSTRQIYTELRCALGKSEPRWALPKLSFDILSRLSPRLKFKLNKLFGNEAYSSAKLNGLGFETTRTLRDINETRY